MMNFDNLINALKENGINAEGITVCKNGCDCLGIRIIDPENPTLAPIIYYSPEETMESILSRILTVKDAGYPCFNSECLHDPAFITRNAYFSIEKRGIGNADILTKPFLDLQLVLRVALTLGDSTGSIKVTNSLLDCCDIGEDELWTIARENMAHLFHIKSMAQMLGIPSDLLGDSIAMYVCTTDSGMNGASVLAFPEVFRRFCAANELERIYILPSSTEEILIVPYGSGTDKTMLAQMVSDVNATCVDPLIQLEPSVYLYDTATDEIRIAATVKGEM